ncbi:DciA family protein [Alphaproteobacteria bacterium]|nr:DciA family protein [Alphaproteobacteria bacterium]
MSQINDKKSPRRGYGLKPLAVMLDQAAGKSLRKRGFIEMSLLQNWPEIVGVSMASWCQPEEIRFPRQTGSGGRRDGKLVLRVSSGRALEIQHQTPLIIAKVNQLFGYQAITSIAIRQGVLSPPPSPRRKFIPPSSAATKDAEKSLPDISDTRLRQALAGLGAAITTNTPAPKKSR